MNDQNKWTADQIPDQTGRVMLVTGANSGLGLLSAQALARKGAQVIMACRDMDKAESAQEQILGQVPDAVLELVHIDLASLDSIHKAAEQVRQTHEKLDVLMNNAGSSFLQRTLSEDGFEKTFALNHLAYFLLTNLLLDVLKKSSPSRIVNTSSNSSFRGKIHFDEIANYLRFNYTQPRRRTASATRLTATR